jgi:hypothetical protein
MMKIGPIRVQADFDPQGQIRPRAFVYQGRSVAVDSIGRQWQARDGQHMLVMDPYLQHYHLVFQPDSGEWYLWDIGQRPPTSRA